MSGELERGSEESSCSVYDARTKGGRAEASCQPYRIDMSRGACAIASPRSHPALPPACRTRTLWRAEQHALKQAHSVPAKLQGSMDHLPHARNSEPAGESSGWECVGLNLRFQAQGIPRMGPNHRRVKPLYHEKEQDNN